MCIYSFKNTEDGYSTEIKFDDSSNSLLYYNSYLYLI